MARDRAIRAASSGLPKQLHDAADFLRWPDHVPVPTFGPRMVCTSCGIIGADVRPNWRERL
jgi:hypothetical protein